MFIITYDHTSDQVTFNSERDQKHAYTCKLGRYNYDNKGLNIEFKFTPALPKKGKFGSKVISISDTFEVDISRREYEEIRNRILSHKVISWKIVSNIIKDVQAGK